MQGLRPLGYCAPSGPGLPKPQLLEPPTMTFYHWIQIKFPPLWFCKLCGRNNNRQNTFYSSPTTTMAQLFIVPPAGESLIWTECHFEQNFPKPLNVESAELVSFMVQSWKTWWWDRCTILVWFSASTQNCRLGWQLCHSPIMIEWAVHSDQIFTSVSSVNHSYLH